MGEASHSNFLAGILTEFRNRALDITQVAQNRATQDSLNLEDTAALRHFASTMASQLQALIPNPQREAQEQREITALQTTLATLQSRITPKLPAEHRSVYSLWIQELGLEDKVQALFEKKIIAMGK